MRSSDYPLPQVIETVLASAEQVLFEMDPNARDAPQLKQRLNAAGTYPGRVRIEQKVSPQTFAYLKRIATVRLSEYEQTRPWAIAFLMLGRSGLESFNPRLGLDRYIYNKARGHARIGGLETTDQFVRAFSSLSDAESEAFLLETIGYFNRCPQLLNDTSDAWRAGDPRRMYRLYAPRKPGRISGYWRWVERRQINWIPKIESALQSGRSTMVVVGALHCCGPNSVLALLQRRGYTVEQM